MGTLADAERSVREYHSKRLPQRALEGNIRAIELRWRQEVSEHHDMNTPTFTDRERGMVRDLIERMGTNEAIRLMIWTVRTWRSHLAYISLTGIPPLPIFQFFYSRRDIFFALMKQHQRNMQYHEKQMSERKEREAAIAQERPKISLTEMVRKIQEEKYAAKQ